MENNTVENKNLVKIGLFGIGLDTYWNQFEGLLKNIKSYQFQIKEKIENFGIEVVDGGMVDNLEKAKKGCRLFKIQRC